MATIRLRLRTGTSGPGFLAPARSGARHAAMIDMGGYKISRTHITMRRRNAKKVIRCFKRAQEEYTKTGTIKRQRAGRIIAFNGMVQNSDSYEFCQKYNVYKLLRVAKKVQKHRAKEARKKRKEYVEYVVTKYRERTEAICGIDGATA